MKKLLLSKLFVLFALLFTGVGIAWADTESTILTLDFSSTAAASGTTSLTTTTAETLLNSAAGLESGITCSAINTVYNGKGQGGGSIPQECLKVGKASGAGSITFTIPSTYDKVNKVEITGYGWKNTSSISINSGTAQTYSTAQTEDTKTFELSTASREIAIAVTSSAVCITEIKLIKVTSSGTPSCATPTFSPAAGTYNGTQNVTISTTTADATIYYTTDGTAPTTSSSVYSSALSISENTTLKAIATASGYDNSSVATAAYTIVTIEHAGTEADPYTVADARNAIDANTGITGVYATGIVSRIYSSSVNSNGQISYYISEDGQTTSPELEAYNGLNIGGAQFTSLDDIQVGDEVIIYGNLKKYNTTYEFDANNQLVSLNRPTSGSTTLYIKADYAPYVYTWEDGSSPANEYTGSWPGVEVTETETLYGTEWYKVTVPADAFNLIMHNNMGGDANQTATIAVTGDTYFFTNCASPALGANQYMVVDPTAEPVSAANVSVTEGETVNADVTNANGLTLTYASGDTSVATVDASTGVVTGVSVGTATITVSWNAQGTVGGTGYLAGSVTFNAAVSSSLPTTDLVFDFEDEEAHRTSGNNDYNANTYEENGTTISLTYADAVTTGTKLNGDANVLGRVAKNTTNSPVVLIGPIANSNYQIVGISYLTKGVAAMSMNVEWSSDNATWTSIQSLEAMPTSATTKEISGLNITDAQVYLRFTVSVESSTSSARDFQLDDVTLTRVATGSVNVTATSNNTAWGTVSVDGNIITATPAEGYRVAEGTTGYSVVSGTATVSHTGYSNTLSVNASTDCEIQVIFEAIPTYEVTITAPENGTLVVKNGDAIVASGDSFAEGTVLTIIATPAEGYNLQHWQANDGTSHSYTTATTWTMTANAVTFSATFVAKVYHTATFSVNGATTSVEVEEGQSITFPADPSDINGKSFRGWYTNHYTSADTAPEYVVTATETMDNSDKTYYAVFSNATGGSGSADVTDVLDNENTINQTTSTYTEWTTSGLNADYAGQSAGGNGAIQLRSSGSNNGVVSTTSAGRVKSVTVTWNANCSNDRTVDVYGSNSAYEAPSDLYDSSKQGTMLGSVTYYTEGNGTTTTVVTVSGDYEYVGLRSHNGALYLDDITIVWATGTPAEYTNFCTEIPVDYTMNAAGMATFVLENDIDAYETAQQNSGLKIYKVDAFTEDEVSMLELGQNDEGTNGSERYIPAGTPVVIEGTANTDYNLIVATATAQTVADNILKAGEDAYPSGVGPFYILQKPAANNVVGFYKLSDGRTVPANRAYLDAADRVTTLPSHVGRKILFIEGSSLTGIDAIENGVNGDSNNTAVYDLSGRRVNGKLSKGIYVVNGKKFIVK